VAQAEAFTLVYTFPSYSSPGWYARVLSVGNTLYGLSTGTYGNGSVFRVNKDGTGYLTLKNFSPVTFNGIGASTNSDGASPLGGLISSGDTLYGTTSAGGFWGLGTVFSLKTNGVDFTVLKHFSGSDGKAPYGEVLLVSNVLYGTTAAGGDFHKGTVFRLNTDGSGFDLLKSFSGSDGLLPLSGLTYSDGVLYGATASGGAWTNGTVFSIHPDGSGFVTLKEFTGQDGASPRYHLVVSGGSIYGTTEGGGLQSLVYQLSTDGTQYNILKSFSTPDPVSGTNDDGAFVQSGLEASGGTLFGSTRDGGFYGSGVLFALRMDGSGYAVLRHFTAGTSNGSGRFVNEDGAAPGPITLAGATLYGIARSGGSAGVGTLFGFNIAPGIQADRMGPGGFEFDIAGYSNQVVSVEACGDLRAPAWLPLATNVIAAGPVHFVDPTANQLPRRFYRLLAQ
jgi:uncharacterized repeat protein (TIGR03803 family)